LAGWLEDSQVRCISDQPSTVHYLSAIDRTKDPKLLTINLAPGVTLAAEAKPEIGEANKGLLVYTINSYRSNGQGPIIAQDTLLTKGQSISILGWKIYVLDIDTNGVLVAVTKNDLNKFQPPAVQSLPQNQNTGLVKVSRFEVTNAGFREIRAIWEVMGHKSFRVYVTEVDGDRRGFYDSGNINDSSNALTMNIGEIICDKDFRVLTEFYTEKNGEGSRLILENRQAKKMSC
jgi:hypothetical protein